jgi:hypothetical protein
MPLFEH